MSPQINQIRNPGFEVDISDADWVFSDGEHSYGGCGSIGYGEVSYVPSISEGTRSIKLRAIKAACGYGGGGVWVNLRQENIDLTGAATIKFAIQKELSGPRSIFTILINDIEVYNEDSLIIGSYPPTERSISLVGYNFGTNSTLQFNLLQYVGSPGGGDSYFILDNVITEYLQIGDLDISSNPSGATIYIDGERQIGITTTIPTINLYQIRTITASEEIQFQSTGESWEGWTYWTKSFEFLMNENLTGSFRLKMEKYFWVGWAGVFQYRKNGEPLSGVEHSMSGPLYQWVEGASEDFTTTLNIGDTIELWSIGQHYSQGLRNFRMLFGYVPQLSMTISISPDNIYSSGSSEISIHVADEDLSPVENANITLSVSEGFFDPATGPTDINGDFISTYTSPIVTSSEIFTISATASKTGYTDGSGFSNITVNPFILTSIEIIPPIANVFVGNTQQFSTICKDQFDEEMICPTIIWDVSDPTIGSISDTGLFTAISEGTVTVIATNEDETVTGTAVVNVIPVAIAGPSAIGLILLGGLLICAILQKRCIDYGTEEKCEKEGCKWIEKTKGCVKKL